MGFPSKCYGVQCSSSSVLYAKTLSHNALANIANALTIVHIVTSAFSSHSPSPIYSLLSVWCGWQGFDQSVYSNHSACTGIVTLHGMPRIPRLCTLWTTGCLASTYFATTIPNKSENHTFITKLTQSHDYAGVF